MCPLRIGVLVLIASRKPRNMLKLKFCVCHLLAGGGLSLFVPQMCLEIANQLKCIKLAKSVTHFPQNVY